MSLALLSQAKKSECGTTQPNSYIADDDVLNEQYAKITTTAQTHTTYEIWYRQTDKQTDRKAGHRVAPQLKKGSCQGLREVYEYAHCS